MRKKGGWLLGWRSNTLAGHTLARPRKAPVRTKYRSRCARLWAAVIEELERGPRIHRIDVDVEVYLELRASSATATLQVA
eukprot:scaffold33859_cov28-Tisochrysis_lutea.AAC.3